MHSTQHKDMHSGFSIAGLSCLCVSLPL